MATFIDDVLDGKASIEDYDLYLDRVVASGTPLNRYGSALGMTSAEYGEYHAGSMSLSEIIEWYRGKRDDDERLSDDADRIYENNRVSKRYVSLNLRIMAIEDLRVCILSDLHRNPDAADNQLKQSVLLDIPVWVDELQSERDQLWEQLYEDMIELQTNELRGEGEG